MVVIVVKAGREGTAVKCPFDATRKPDAGRSGPSSKPPDGCKRRIYGTPGIPGPYQDLPRTKVGAQQAEQRAIASALRGDVERELVPPAQEVEPTKTIRQHAEHFVEKYKRGSKPSERREKQRVLDSHLLPYFGDMTIEDLVQADVDTFAQRELDRGIAVKTVNNQLAVLSTLIKYVKRERSRLRFKLDGMVGEIHAVAPEDVELLLGEAPDARYVAVILSACVAGLRVGEIRGLQWNDLRDGQLTVRRALNKQTNESIAPKHNKSRNVPLSKRLIDPLGNVARVGLWVIAEPDGGSITYDRVSQEVNEMYTRAGVVRPPKPLHCLRHRFGTVMARQVPLNVLRELMGHADIKTTLRYIDVSEDDKRRAIASVFGAVARRGSRKGGRRGGAG